MGLNERGYEIAAEMVRRADALAVALTDYHLRLRPLLFGTAIVRIRSSRA